MLQRARGALEDQHHAARTGTVPVERLKKLPDENDEYDVSDILIAIPPDATQVAGEGAGEEGAGNRTSAPRRRISRSSRSRTPTPRPRLEGGALGWRKGSNLPTDLAEAIVTLKAGEVSKPLAHAQRLPHREAQRPAPRRGDNPMQDQVHVRHILITPNTLQDDATVQPEAGRRPPAASWMAQDFAVFASTMSRGHRHPRWMAARSSGSAPTPSTRRSARRSRR